MALNQLVNDHRKPTLSHSLNPHPQCKGAAPLTVEYTYHNFTGKPVVVGLKNGLKFTLKPDFNSGGSGLVIKVIYRLHEDVAKKMINYLLNTEYLPDDSLALFKEGLIDHPTRIGDRYVVILDYKIDKRMLPDDGSSLYVTDADIVITLTGDATLAPPHPNSEAGKRAIHGADTISDDFVFKIEMVDNTDSISPKFIYVNGDVYKIFPKADANRKDGIYKYSRLSADKNMSDMTSYENYSDFSDLPSCGLYASIEEALYQGNAGIAKQAELDAESHRAATEKYRAEFAKQEAARTAAESAQKADHERHLKEMEILNAKHVAETEALNLKLKQLAATDQFEERSIARKDSSEFMKHMPVIILGAVAAIGALLSVLR